MKRIHRIKLWILLLVSGIVLVLFPAACTGISEGNDTATRKEIIMLYMVGSDLESERGLASEDIQEIQDSGFDEDHVQIVLCTGGAAHWWNPSISEEECGIFELRAQELKKVSTLNYTNMAEVATLTAFMDYVYNNYTADCYSLILWNHGGGAVVGYGGDENHGYDTLTLYELDRALGKSRLIAEGKKLEWIGFDACLMGMLEVASACAPYAEYLVASEGMASEQGWDYAFLSSIRDESCFSGEVTGREIVDAYAAYYDSMETCQPEYTLACMDLSETEYVIEKLEEFILTARTDLMNGSYSRLARERDRTKAFSLTEITGSSVDYDTVDLYNLSEQFAEYHPEEAAALQEAIRKLVVYEKTNVADANGVAIYFPYENKEAAPDWLAEYNRLPFCDTYVEFVKGFSQVLTGERLTNWDFSGTASVKRQEQEYSVSLTPEQTEHYAHASFSVWERIEEREGYEDCYVMWTESSDTTLDGEGKLSAIMNGKRFLLYDDAGHSVPCSAMELERNDEYVTYGIGVYLSWVNKEAEDYASKFGSEWATIYVRVDEENPEGVITGIYKGYDSLDIQVPGRVSYEIGQGVTVAPFAFIRKIAFDAEGNVAPFEEWENNSNAFVGFRLNGDLSVTMVDIDSEAELCQVFFITDTQGYIYETNYIEE
ncbi:MAG: hypothetical protein K2N24_07445 [Lachnospiraceae bacterium]|nr:hypothetical protein [Lachnospiraceae bacterium]